MPPVALPEGCDLVTARAIQADSRQSPDAAWSLDALAGRLIELTDSLTAAAGLIAEAQWRGEPAAWIGAGGSSFYPPDFAASGVDLDALPVVRVADSAQVMRAADTLIRSGGFAAVVLDPGPNARLPLNMQSRLVGLAKAHHAAVVLLTRRAASGPQGALASLRGEVTRKRTGFDRFACELRVVKDKRRGPGWRRVEVCRGPDGLH